MCDKLLLEQNQRADKKGLYGINKVSWKCKSACWQWTTLELTIRSAYTQEDTHILWC